MSKTYAQLGQDTYVLNQIYNGKKDGFYVDVGAYDGKELSNTLLLQQNGWSGICIEPNPNAFKRLKNLRKRRVTNVKYAVYSKSGLAFEFSDANMLSGITHCLDKYKDLQGMSEAPKYKVKTKTLTDILNDNNAPTYIEYLSIDTEGSEMHVLQGIDFEKYTFGFINIEHNYVEPRRSEMRSFLKDHGYMYHRENNWDDDYIHKSLHKEITAKKSTETISPNAVL